MRGIDHPALLLLAIGSLDPTLPDFACGELVEDGLVLKCELFGGKAVSADIEAEHFGRAAHALTCSNEGAAVGGKPCEGVVGHFVGEGFDPSFKVCLVDVRLAVPNTGKVKALAVFGPQELVDAALERLGHVAFLAGGEFHDAETGAVALVSVALHAGPCDVLPVWRETWVLVIAQIEVGFALTGLLAGQRPGRVELGRLVPLGLAEVACAPAVEVEEEDVAVRADSVVTTGLLATGVGYCTRVGAPRQLFDASKGQHGAFEGFAGKQVKGVGDGIVGGDGHEGMWDGSDVVVPVFVHQVVDDHAGGLWQVSIVLLDNAVERNVLDENDATAVGREAVAGNVALFV